MALISMTGFGRAEAVRGELQLSVELRSVNHRFLDTSIRLPNGYGQYEQKISQRLKAALKRGRVEVNVSRRETTESVGEVVFHPEKFAQIFQAIESATSRYVGARWLFRPLLAARLLERREVFETTSTKQEAKDEWPMLEEVLEGALSGLVSMRVCEGEVLEKSILSDLGAMAQVVGQIEAHSHNTVEQFRKRLSAKIEKLQGEVAIEPERVAAEIAMLAERLDISEELVRLRSHIEQFQALVNGAEGGRKLEFLLQEMGREINTAGTKAQNSEISTYVVDGKALLERIREQILNIE